MTDTILHCPSCGHEIALSEALTSQLRSRLEAGLQAEHEAHLGRAVAEAEARAAGALQAEVRTLTRQLADQTRHARAAEDRELELKRRTLALEEQSRTLAERTRLEIEEELRIEADARAKDLVAQTEARMRKDSAKALQLVEQQLAEQRHKTREAQEAELALRSAKTELEERARELDLEVARRVEHESRRLEEGVRKSMAEEQSLKLREREKQIGDLRDALDALKRKSEQGSQELQGEVLELDIQAMLESRFPRDAIAPVPRGMKGADLMHDVRDAALEPCGRIVWEVKNTKVWQPAWLAKLRDDQRACGASVAVLISVALPEEARGSFALIDGIWVTGLTTWPALAVALREQLLEVAFARNAATGMQDKMQALYHYLAGDAFRHKVEAIVEAFRVMREQLDRERRAMERLWKEREKQLDRIITSTAGMYGELRGTIGQAMQPIAALELDDPLLLGVEER
jgi:hypothetical protein